MPDRVLFARAGGRMTELQLKAKCGEFTQSDMNGFFPDARHVRSTDLAKCADFFALLKPRVMSLVVFTGVVGLAVAPVKLHPFLAFIAILCIALSAGGCAAINMWYDADIDAVMRRTQNRPIPKGKIAAVTAAEFGGALILFSVLLMALAINILSAFLLAFAAFFYLVIYTAWLKRRTPQNIVIGGAAGAFPPVIAWAAATGQLDWQAWILFAIVFFWTPPHFWALALYRNEDYSRAKIPMLPVVCGVRRTKRDMLIYTLLLLPLAILPYFAGLGGVFYLAGALALGFGFVYWSVRVWFDESFVSAKKMFVYSLFYLAGIFSLLLGEHLFGVV